jgi:negative elongation factor A
MFFLKFSFNSGQLNSDISIPETNRKIFNDLLVDLKKSLKKSSDRKDIVLPLECHYLNKNAFLSVVGHQPQTTKHFSLRRKPKAAALRAELLNKSQVSRATRLCELLVWTVF